MTRWESRTVEQFNVGDRIRLYGWSGWVAEVEHQNRNGKPCTYLRVRFDSPSQVGYQYHDSWYGGLDGVVAYGYGTEKITL